MYCGTSYGDCVCNGTPLQGSLGWGMNVITGGSKDDAEETAEPETESAAGSGAETEAIEGSSAETESSTDSGAIAEMESTPESGTQTGMETQQAESVSLLTRLKGNAMRVCRAVWEAAVIYLIPGDNLVYQIAVFAAIGLLCVLAILFFLRKQTDYAARFLSTAVFMALMSILLGASRIGLPALMDAIRTCIFYAYTIVIVWSFCVDGMLQLLFGWEKKERLVNAVSLLLLGAAGVFIVREDLMKEPRIIKAMQTNEAVTCLTNIIHDEPDGTWTICSANDELRMGEDYGYHYEISSFLSDMEYSGGYSSITLPTHTVYFFIEKKPLDYAVPYENSGQYISEKGAARRFRPHRGSPCIRGRTAGSKCPGCTIGRRSLRNYIPMKWKSTMRRRILYATALFRTTIVYTISQLIMVIT